MRERWSRYWASAQVVLGVLIFGVCTDVWSSPVDSQCAAELLSEPDSEGIVADGVPLHFENLMGAYRNGVFPWGTNADGTATWFSLPERGILDFGQMRISSKDAKFLRQHSGVGARPDFRVTFDLAFEQVVRACSRMPRPGQDGTWISEPFVAAYTDLHRRGFAHSVEVWARAAEGQPDELVGGLYGVFVEGVFAGESMFHTRDNAAKLALWSLVERLKAQGHTWIDTQQVAGLIEKWGGIWLPRAEFLKRLRVAQAVRRQF